MDMQLTTAYRSRFSITSTDEYFGRYSWYEHVAACAEPRTAGQLCAQQRNTRTAMGRDANRGAALVIAAVPRDGKPDGEPSSAARKLENQATLLVRKLGHDLHTAPR